MKKINSQNRIYLIYKKKKLEITKINRSKKNLIAKKNNFLTSNLLFSIFTIIFLSISLSNEKKLQTLRNLENDYSEISITIKGGSEQNIISSSASVVNKLLEVSINGAIQDSPDIKISGLEENKEVEVSMKFSSPIHSLEKLFFNLENIIRVDLSNFDTSNLEIMNLTFSGCKNLESINFGENNIYKINSMNHLFQNCMKLTSLDLSNFDTSKVSKMVYLFYNCNSLKYLNIPKFNTSSVKDMNSMFFKCSELTSLNLQNFDTSSVTTMYQMFYGCSQLLSLDLSNFSTLNVKNMEGVFRGCSKLEYINVSSFDTSSVEKMKEMFYDCKSITSLDLSNFNTQKLNEMESMFRGCNNLLSLDLSNFKTSLVTSFLFLFNDCYKLTSLDISSFNTIKCTNMKNMFSNCESLKSIDLSSFNTEIVSNMQYMFSGCKNILSLDLSNFNTAKAPKIDYMFNNCESLIFLNLNSFNQIGSIDNTFSGISTQLKYCINEENNDLKNLLDSKNIIADCNDPCFKLENIKIILDKKECIENCINDREYLYEYKNICYKACPKCTQESLTQSHLCEKDFNCKEEIEELGSQHITDRIKEIESYIITELESTLIEKKLESTLIEKELESTQIEKELESTQIEKELDNTQIEKELESTQIEKELESTQIENSIEKSILIEKEIEITQIEKEIQSTQIEKELERTQIEKEIEITQIEKELENTQIEKSIESTLIEKAPESTLFEKELESTLIEKLPESTLIEKELESTLIEKAPESTLFEKELKSTMIEKELESILIEKAPESSLIEKAPESTLIEKELETTLIEKELENTQIEKVSKSENIKETEEKIEVTFPQEYESELIINCSAQDLFITKSCGSEISSPKNKDQIISNIKKDIMEGNITDILKNQEEDLVFQTEDTTYQVTTTDNQNNNEYKNISTVKLGDCEDRLKNIYGINANQSLIIFKIDYYSPGLLIPIIGYEIFHPENKSKLDLNYCKDILIELNIPVTIDEENLFKYDPNSEYYKDECIPSTSENGTDIILNDRQNEYNTNNLSLCQNNCTFSGYDTETKKAICDCEIKTKINLISEIIDDKNILSANNFTSNDDSSSNVITMKCIYTLFTKKGLKNNIGSYILILNIAIFLVSSILFYKVGYPVLENDIRIIIIEKENIINNKNNKKFYNGQKFSKKKKSKIKKKKIGKKGKKNTNIFDINFPPKKRFSIPKQRKSCIKQSDSISQSKLELKDIQVVINLEKRRKSCFNKNTKLKNKKFLEKIEKESNDAPKDVEIINYNEYELNTLNYKEALLYDKRKFSEYYISFLKSKQLVLFAFFPVKDYNITLVKVNIFFLSFSIYYAINALFFNESTIHKIYEDGGSYNFIYLLPKILFSFVISHFFSSVIKNIFLSERNIVEIKKAKLLNDSKDKIEEVKKCLTIKYIIFYVSGILFLIFFWYYLSSFGAVYQNSQRILIKNTIISFAISLIYPFIINIIPSILRKISLKDTNSNRECLFKISRIIQYI